MALSFVAMWKAAKDKAETERKAAGREEVKPGGRTKIESHLKEIESMIASKKDRDKINAKIVQLRADMASYKSALPGTEATLIKALDKISEMLKALEKTILVSESAHPGMSKKYYAIELQFARLNQLVDALDVKRKSLETKIASLTPADEDLYKNIAKLDGVMAELDKIQVTFNKVFVELGKAAGH